MPKAETPLLPEATTVPAESLESLNVEISKARTELAELEGQIIRERALCEVEIRQARERNTRAMATEYARIIENANLKRREVDEYSAATRAKVDEELRAARTKITNDLRDNAMRLTKGAKDHRNTMKGYAAEAAEAQAELVRLADDQQTGLAKRFVKAKGWLDNLGVALAAVETQMAVGATLKPLVPPLLVESNYPLPSEVPN